MKTKLRIILVSVVILIPQGAHAMNIPLSEYNKLSGEQLSAKLAMDSLTITSDPIPGNTLLVIPKLGTGTNQTPEPTPNPGASLPTQLIPDLLRATVMLPTGKQGDPDNLYAVKAETDANAKKYFYADNGAVVFKVNAGGVHSTNSKYPRTEAREMKNTNWGKGVWTNQSGTHVLEATLSATHNFVKKPELVVGQIHDGSDDVLQIRLVGNTLKVAGRDDKYNTVIDSDFKQGQKFSYRVEASNGFIRVFYSKDALSELKLVFIDTFSGSGWYFKYGAYAQTSPAVSGEDPTATAEVRFYSAKITHQ